MNVKNAKCSDPSFGGFQILFSNFKSQESIFMVNKRAQSALGRSPEEKVKGHSGAIYRGLLMLSTKNW